MCMHILIAEQALCMPARHHDAAASLRPYAPRCFHGMFYWVDSDSLPVSVLSSPIKDALSHFRTCRASTYSHQPVAAAMQSAMTIAPANRLDFQLPDVLQAVDALHGKGPLFAMRLTHLGDGNSIVALTWLHLVSDGMKAINNAFVATLLSCGSSLVLAMMMITWTCVYAAMLTNYHGHARCLATIWRPACASALIAARSHARGMLPQ